jgi:hypothetical protein
MSKSEIEAKIEYQKIIGDANPGGYQPIIFSKIKYKACNYTHIDIRKYQRASDDEGEEVYYPTKNGFRFPEKEFNRVIKEYTLLPQTYIHPKIIKKSFSLLEKNEFESAVFQAFKLLETSIRKKIGAKSEEIGVKLIRKHTIRIMVNYQIITYLKLSVKHFQIISRERLDIIKILVPIETLN